MSCPNSELIPQCVKKVLFMTNLESSLAVPINKKLVINSDML